MCGLTYCKHLQSNKSAKNIIKKRYEKQKNRGTQGFGYVEIKNGIVSSEIRTQTEKEILSHLETSEAEEILFHHRTPTSTPNFIESTHPIKVSHKSLKYNYYVIHNGVISNDTELKEEHNKQGFNYITEITKKWVTSGNIYSETMFNDSESLAIDFCLSLEKNQPMKSKGSIALIALQFEKETGKAINLFFGRNYGNPLCLEKNNEFIAISSETGKEITANTLYCFNYETQEITQTPKDIGIREIKPVTSYTFNYDSGYNKRIGFNTYETEEEDYEYYDYDSEIEYIEEEMQKALNTSDYELYTDLETELQELKIMKDSELKAQYQLY